MVGAQDRRDPQSTLQLAARYYQQGHYGEALQAFDRVIEAGDESLVVPARKGKVRAALRIAEFDLARREADVLLTEVPGDPEAVALSGDALWAIGLFDEAEAAYRQASQLSPFLPRALHGLSRALASRTRLSEALDQILGALDASPDDPDLHAQAAAVYERLGRYDEAARAYARYAELLGPAEEIAIAAARGRAELLRSFGRRTPAAIEPEDAGRAHTMPFKLVRNKVVLQGRINGARVEWVLDTGAERTGVSHEVAEAARLRAAGSTLTAGIGRPALRRVALARADRLEIGTLRLRNVPVAVRNPVIGGTPRWQGESLSPLALGLSVVVDYRRREVTFARELPDSPGGVTLKLRVQRLPLVRGVLNGRHPAPFIVDTGGEVISIGADTARAIGATPPRLIPLRVFGLSGPDETAFLLPGVDLDFDEIGYRKVGLAVLNLRIPSALLGFRVGGILGHKLLGEYRVEMDVARSELRLSR